MKFICRGGDFGRGRADVPGGLELLAVAAPGREELDEDLRFVAGRGDGVGVTRVSSGSAVGGARPGFADTIVVRQAYAEALYCDARASRADILEALVLLEDVVRALRRILGKHHPDTLDALADLERARMKREDVAA